MATTATKASKADQARARYEVTSPLDHDQVRYEIGETVELTASQAEPLLGLAVKAMPAG